MPGTTSVGAVPAPAPTGGVVSPSAPRDPGDAPGATTWSLDRGDPIAPGLLALEPLGGGDVFETYLAWDSARFTGVVAKLLRPHLLDDDWARGSLAAEAELVHALSHPFIVRTFGADLAGDRPYLLLEHLDGPTLADVLSPGRGAALHELLPLVFHLASALHYLGTRGVVHLDVKPCNIVMGEQPRLIDFSLARHLERLARMHTQVGTDAYMAPEQCTVDRTRLGTPADVWGLGVTLYESACGRRPFPAPPRRSAADLPLEQRYPQLVAEPAPPPRDVPAPLAQLMLACLAPEPADRPTPAQVVLALEPMLAALPRPVPGKKKLFYV